MRDEKQVSKCYYVDIANYKLIQLRHFQGTLYSAYRCIRKQHSYLINIFNDKVFHMLDIKFQIEGINKNHYLNNIN